MHRSPGLVKEREALLRQGLQPAPLVLFERSAHLLLRRAVNARVGHRGLPALQVPILRFETLERMPLQAILLHVVDASLDLPLVTRHARLRRQDRHPVMLAEGPDFRIDLRFKPVALGDRGPQIVDDQRQGNAPEVPKGILQATHEVFRRLVQDRFAVGLPRMTEDHPQHVRPSLAALRQNERRAHPKIDLSLGARLAFHPAKRQPPRFSQAMHEAPHAPVLPREAVIGSQVLEDPLG